MKVCIAQNVSLSDHLALSTYLRSISKYLAAQKNIDLTLLTLKGLELPEDLPKNISVQEIKGDLYSISGNIKYALGLYRELSRIKDIDIIHCLYPNSSLLGAVLFKQKAKHVKIIYDIRSPWIEMSIERGSISKYVAPIYRKAAYLGEYFLSNYGDGFIFITEGIRKFYKNKINLGKKLVWIVPSGVDLNIFMRKNPDIIRENYNIRTDECLIGYVGGIASIRDLSFVLIAFKELISKSISKSHKKYKLMLVGDGDDKDHLEELAMMLRIGDFVIFTGRVPYEQVPYYMSSFNIGLCHLPDRFIFKYSFPMKVLEYLACGVPVVVSDIEAHREMRKRLSNIYTYGFSIKSFIETIDSVKLDKTSDTDREKLKTEYEWDILSRKCSSLYTSAIRQ